MAVRADESVIHELSAASGTTTRVKHRSLVSIAHPQQTRSRVDSTVVFAYRILSIRAAYHSECLWCAVHPCVQDPSLRSE